MNDINYIYPIGLVIAYFIVQYTTAKQLPADYDGKYTMKMPSFLKVVSLICMLLVTVGFCAYLFFEKEYEREFLIGFSIVFLATAYLCLLARNHSIRFDDETVEMRNSLGRITIVKWTELVDCGFIYFFNFITLKDRQGKKVFIYYYLNGLEQFLRKFDSKTKWSRSVLPIRHRKNFKL